MMTQFTFTPVERVRKQEREKEGGPLPVVSILLMSMTYSTDTDIRTVVKHWHDVDMTVCRVVLGLFLQRTVRVSW